MSICPRCIKRGLKRRVKKKNRKKVKNIWVHKICPKENK